MLLPRIYEKSEELKLLPHHEEYKGTISLNGIKMKRFTSDMWNGFIMSGDEIDKEVQNGTFLNSLLEAELDTGEKLRLTIPEHGYEFRNRLFKSCAALLEPPVETK